MDEQHDRETISQPILAPSASVSRRASALLLVLKPHSLSSLKAILSDLDIEAKPIHLRTKTAIAKYLSGAGMNFWNQVQARLNESSCKGDDLRRFTKEELSRAFHDHGVSLARMDLKNRTSMTEAFEKLPAPLRANMMEALEKAHTFKHQALIELEDALSAFSVRDLRQSASNAGMSVRPGSNMRQGVFARYLLKVDGNVFKSFLVNLRQVNPPMGILVNIAKQRMSTFTFLNTPNPAFVLEADREHTSDSGFTRGPFLECATETRRRELVDDFRIATSQNNVKQVVCCVCASEVFLRDATATEPRSIPNTHLLRPSKLHRAQELTDGMLLYIDAQTRVVPHYTCNSCLSDLTGASPKRPALSLANNMWIGDIPFELRNLTLCERVLIARYYAAAYIVKLYPKHGGHDPAQLTSGLRGNVSTYFLNTERLSEFVDHGFLPPNPKILSATVGVTFVGKNREPLKTLPKSLVVRRDRVLMALRWLVINNPLYRHISISQANIELLPQGEVPLELLHGMRWLEDESVLNEEHGGYVPEDEFGGDVDPEREGELDSGSHYFLYLQTITKVAASVEQDQEVSGNVPLGVGAANVEHVHLQSHGVIDVNGITIGQSEILAHAMRNASGASTIDHLWITPSGFVNTYARKDSANKLTIGTPEDPNHLLGSFPHLFPYGEGGLETERPENVSYAEHVRWLLQYADKRFRLDERFVFQVFGVIQKRDICAKAGLRISRRDFKANEAIIRSITKADLIRSSDEEKRHQPFSHPGIRALRKHLNGIRAKVLGTDESRRSVRAQIWSMITVFGPPSLWITINPSDTHNPIAQVFAGVEIDLDHFDKSSGPDATARAINIARDPYAAALFFHFIINVTIETLYGFKTRRHRHPERHVGILGMLQSYIGMVESQGRGTLHLHMIVWLQGAPTSAEMSDALRSPQFRDKVAAFIRDTIRADTGMSVSELRATRPKPTIGYARPLPTTDVAYEQKRAEQEALLVRTLQLHKCSPRSCLINRQGRLVCKRRAPWSTSDVDFIHEDGNWGMRRLDPYINAYNPTILETQFCNNDQKLITNGRETQGTTAYISDYSTKGRKKSSNSSALLAEKLALHEQQEEANTDLHDVSKKLIMRCATTLSRQQELSAPEVITYLMGWGDRYISHNFTPIYLEGVAAMLRNAFVILQRTKWENVVSDEGEPQVIEIREDVDGETDQLPLRIVNGNLGTHSQLDDYCRRAASLDPMNFRDFCMETYDKREAPNPARRNTSKRHPYLSDSTNNHVRIQRRMGHETVPLFLGRWFPRNDRPEDRTSYILTMLAVLKPWRRITDITKPHATFEEAWSAFVQQASSETHRFLDNVQYFYTCSDSRSISREQEFKTYIETEPDDDTGAPKITGTKDVHGESSTTVAESEIVSATNRERMDMELYGQTAIEHAYSAGVFQRQYELPLDAPFARCCSSAERLLFQRWQTHLTDYTIAGGNITSAFPLEHLGQPTVSSHPMVEVNLDQPALLHGTPYDEMYSLHDKIDRRRKALNEEQLRGHDMIVQHLLQSMQKPTAQLLLLLRGAGGTGKTALINAISDSFTDLGCQSYLAKTATSGIAASQFGGKTLHTWAGIKIAASATDDLISNASISIERRRTANIGPTKYLIIDECSMATKELLGRVSTICAHVKSQLGEANNDHYFGAINVILCGDFHQFPPVGNPRAALYEESSSNNAYATLGRYLYQQFDKVVTLTKQIRVKDGRWMELLARLRHGSCTSDDMEILRRLRLDIPENEPVDFDSAEWSSAILITPRNSVRRKWNRLALRRHCLRQKVRLYSCPADDTIGREPLSNGERLQLAALKSKQTGNLEHRVEIAIGMKAMVVVNISTEADLANGTRGTITDIILDDREPDHHETFDGATLLSYPPAAVLMTPNDHTDVSMDGLPVGLLPILPQEVKFNAKVGEKTRRITRRQLALTPAYAFTDFKGQGQTIEYAIVDLFPPKYGGKLDAFSAYVSLSRSRGRNTIRLLRAFDENLFVNHPSPTLEKEDHRLDQLEARTKAEWSLTSSLM